MKCVKKLICYLLVFCMTVSMLPLQVFAEDVTDGSVVASGICGDNLTWALVDGILTISGEGWMDEYSGNNNAPWYAYRSNIKTVDIEDGVESIGMSAFSDCDILTEVVFSETVGYIGPYALKNCVALTNIDIPAKVQYVNMGTFLGCTSLQNVSIPNSVTGIGYEAFRDCESLASLALPDSVTIIEDGAFYYCTSLESIYIPDSVTNMEGGIFNGCASLKQITIPEGTTTVGNVMFAECISLESVDIPSTISLIDTSAFINCQSLSNIEIPNNVEKINDNAFEGCTSLKDIYYAGTEEQWNTITIESGNTELVDATIHYSGSDSDDHTHSYVSVVTNPTCTESGYTTYTCSCGNSYTDDYIAANGHEYGNWYETKAPTQDAEGEERRDCESCDHYETRVKDKLSSISKPENTFSGNLTWTLADGVLTIDGEGDMFGYDHYAYFPWADSSESICKVVIENGVTAIGKYAFCRYNNLTTVNIGNDVTMIGEYSFYDCTKLTSIVIPESVNTILNYAFYNCKSLKDIYYGGTKEQWESIYKHSFNYSLDDAVIHYNSNGPENQDNATQIPDRAQHYNGSYYSVYSLSGYTWASAKAYCENLGGHLATITSAEEQAFVESLSGGNTNLWIGGYRDEAFNWYWVTGEEWEYANWGSNQPDNSSNVVPNENCLAIWPKLWNDLNDNNTMEQVGFICEWETEKLEISGTCGTNLTWKLADGLLTITGEGAIPDYASNNLYGELAPWYEYRSEITKIEIGAGITSIGKNAFYSCTEVKTIVIPDGISSIAYGAFTACTGLRAVEIPASVTLIDDSAFFLCINLEDVYFTGTEEEWAAIEIGENNFEDVKIHFNSKMPENAADSYPDDTETPDYLPTTQEVMYLREMIENNGKQYAAFGGYQEKFTTYYDITEETDTSFLENKWKYLNNYVLVTSQKRPDTLEGNRILLSVELVKTGIDVISEVSVYGKTITIGNQIYPVSENVHLNSDFKDKTLLYHMMNGEIIGLEKLSTIEGTLCYYDDNNIEIIVKGYGGAKQTYRLYGDVAENAKDLLECSIEETIYAALDHYNGVVHKIRTWDGESYYSVYKTEEERAKALQIERDFAYWNQKYQEYLNAVENVLHTFSGIKEEPRENFIADKAEGMKNSDYISNDALLGDYKMLTYRALATFFLDCMCTTVPNFSALDYSDENLAVSIANKIIDNINSEQRVYTFEDITVEIVGLEQFGYAYGTITVYTKNENPIRTSFSMPHKECAAIIKSFIDELEDIAIDVTWNVATAVCDDLLGVLVNENLSSYSEKKVQDIFNKIGEKYNVVIYNELKKLDVGNLEEVLNICYSFYKEVEEALEAGKKGDISKIVSYVNGSKYETLLSRKILDDVNDAIVSEAMNTLNAAAKSLNNAFKEYLEDNTVKTKYSKNRINCPVNVAVYNSSGVQVGYVGDDDLWYTDAIHIDKFGDSKEIVSLTNDALSFMITATDFGTMSCSFEEYDDTFAPVGRLNYYDIALAPEQIFCVTVLDNLAEQMDSLAITSNNESIYADEYVPVDNNAYAIVSCKLESGNESIGGSVTGTGSYVRGDAVVLISKPYDGFDFVGWFDGDTLLSTDRIFEFTVKEDRHLTARFFKDDYIRIDLEADAGGIVLGDGKYQSGETVSILAVPYKGYAFAGWYIEDELISAESEYSFEVSTPLTINAKFESHEHIYSKPVFVWAKDNACTAIFSCTASDNVQTLDCTVTSTTSPATESEAGEIVYTATVEFNGQTYTDTKTVTIPATGHVTHTAESEWLSDDTQHWHKCTGCDEKLDVTEHSGGMATCTKNAVCEVCGTSYDELKPHEYKTTWSKGDSNGHWHECKNCSAHDTAVKHTPGAAATETKAQTCTVCGYVITPALGHTCTAGSKWYSNGTSHWHLCTSCGAWVKTSYHSYSNDTDETCNVCGYTRTVTATEPTEETEATVLEITEETEVTQETTVETSLATEPTEREENKIIFGDEIHEASDSKSSDVSGMLIVTLIIVMICSLVGVVILLIYRKRNKMN